MSKILDIQGLTVQLPKNADRLYAVKNIDIAVNTEEIVCVVGESGSGKSVTAFTVMGLHDSRALTPVAGSITLDGEDILNAPRQYHSGSARTKNVNDFSRTNDGTKSCNASWRTDFRNARNSYKSNSI